MSAAAAPTIEDAVAAAPPAKAPRGKKKLLVMIAAALIVLLAAGGGAVWYLKHRAAAAAAAADAEEGDAPAAAKPGAHDDAADPKAAKVDPGHPPTFLPLDPFVVNLADKEAERFAQIGITLEVENANFADQAKAYMPAIRNSILMILAHKTSQELLGREGKEKLAEEIRRETVRPMGIDIPAPASELRKEASSGHAASGAASQAKRLAKPPAGPNNPVRHVHFSSFIIQ